MSCWGESDFMHTKNGITVALQVIKFFPVMDINGLAVEKAVKVLVDSKDGNITADVQALCNSYLLHLKKRQTTRPFVSTAAFHGIVAAPRKVTPPVGPPPSATSDASKTAPTGPKSSTNGEVPAKPEDGLTVQSTRLSVVQSADSLALRQKLEEARPRGVSATVVKEETKCVR